jgi:hypothetical protein
MMTSGDEAKEASAASSASDVRPFDIKNSNRAKNEWSTKSQNRYENLSGSRNVVSFSVVAFAGDF